MADYDCSKCPAFCCGYPIIEATKRDIRRLARHFGVDEETARERYTEKENNRVRKLKQRADPRMGAKVCMFLNQRTRNCGVYEGRPQICRDYPGDRCEWNDRRLLESGARGGRKVWRLKVAPWRVHENYPNYIARRLPALVEAYADGGDGRMAHCRDKSD